jgi:hypothetical protein
MLMNDESKWKVALVGALDNPRLAEHVSTFVHEVDRIKNIRPRTRAKRGLEFFEGESFHETARYNVEGLIERKLDHPFVVNQLWQLLKKIPGIDLKRSQIDLCVSDKSYGKVKVIFEIETDTSTTSVYEAIGQLVYYSVDYPNSKLVAVFPKDLPPEVTGRLQKKGIHSLLYGWQENQIPYFERSPVTLVNSLMGGRN